MPLRRPRGASQQPRLPGPPQPPGSRTWRDKAFYRPQRGPASYSDRTFACKPATGRNRQERLCRCFGFGQKAEPPHKPGQGERRRSFCLSVHPLSLSVVSRLRRTVGGSPNGAASRGSGEDEVCGCTRILACAHFALFYFCIDLKPGRAHAAVRCIECPSAARWRAPIGPLARAATRGGARGARPPAGIQVAGTAGRQLVSCGLCSSCSFCNGVS